MTGRDDFDRTLAGWFEAEALSSGARRWPGRGPRGHPPPPAPAGLARRSWQPLGRRSAGSRGERGRPKDPVVGRAPVHRAPPAIAGRGPPRRGDPGRSATPPAPAPATIPARPARLRPERRHLRGERGRPRPSPRSRTALPGSACAAALGGRRERIWSPNGRYLAYRSGYPRRVPAARSWSSMTRGRRDRCRSPARAGRSHGPLTPAGSRRGSTSATRSGSSASTASANRCSRSRLGAPRGG